MGVFVPVGAFVAALVLLWERFVGPLDLAVMTAMWQVIEGYFLDSQSSACCLVHLLVTGGHLLRMAIGAA